MDTFSKKRRIALYMRAALWLLLLGLGLGVAWTAADGGDRRQALVLTVADAIGPATGDYIIRGIAQAGDQKAELLVLKLDTPGGLDSSMRDIVKAMLASEVPVVTYVHPAGGRAASAGTYLLYASHVAAMTPATNLGSATPVQMGGGGLPGFDDGTGGRWPGREDSANDSDEARTKSEPAKPESTKPESTKPEPTKPESTEPESIESGPTEPGSAEPEPAHADQSDREPSLSDPASPESNATAPDALSAEATGAEANDSTRRGETAMERKVLEDAVAFIRGLAERFDRNADWAEEAVREGVNLTAREALKLNVIDFVADNLDDLLRQLDGHVVQMPWGERVLQTADIEVVMVDPDWRTRLLAVITSPNVAYILMLIGIYGIIFELSNPGSIYPGVIGAISLMLAFYALQVMPVNYVGLALIILGLAFMIAEAFLPSFGVLGIGGFVAFITGSIILWDDPDLNVSIPMVIGTGVLVAFFSIWVLARLWRMRGVKPGIGLEEMHGMIGEAREDFERSGRVYVHSELWTADSPVPIRAGQKVEVTGVQGLRLQVKPVPETEPPDAS